MASYYDVLGVDDGASPQAIRNAYREKIKLCHPDVSHNDPTAAEFRAIREAFETLSDPARRSAYDRGRLAAIPVRVSGRTRQAPFAEPSAQRSLRWGDFFGHRWPFEESLFAERPDFELRMSPLEARSGGRIVLPVEAAAPCPRCRGSFAAVFFCPLCAGSGLVRVEREYALRVPPGVWDGALLRVETPEGQPVAIRVRVVGGD